MTGPRELMFYQGPERRGGMETGWGWSDEHVPRDVNGVTNALTLVAGRKVAGCWK